MSDIYPSYTQHEFTIHGLPPLAKMKESDDDVYYFEPAECPDPVSYPIITDHYADFRAADEVWRYDNHT